MNERPTKLYIGCIGGFMLIAADVVHDGMSITALVAFVVVVIVLAVEGRASR